MKFGFDIHGVLDDLPDTFKALNNALFDAGHEIHILTGSHITDEIQEELRNMGIKYHHIFSIVDYHIEKGTKIWYDDNDTPWLDEEGWNKTKGDYCKKHNIDLHFDDTEIYNEYFTTPFARVWTKNGKGNKSKGSALSF
jgi:hypothetical protein